MRKQSSIPVCIDSSQSCLPSFNVSTTLQVSRYIAESATENNHVSCGKFDSNFLWSFVSWVVWIDVKSIWCQDPCDSQDEIDKTWSKLIPDSSAYLLSQRICRRFYGFLGSELCQGRRYTAACLPLSFWSYNVCITIWCLCVIRVRVEAKIGMPIRNCKKIGNKFVILIAYQIDWLRWMKSLS